jgi:hypothetical protein
MSSGGAPMTETSTAATEISPRARGWLSLGLVVHLGVLAIAWSISGGASQLQLRMVEIVAPYLAALHLAPPTGLAWVDGGALGQPHVVELSADGGATWRIVPSDDRAERSAPWRRWMYAIGHYNSDLEQRDAAAVLAAAACDRLQVRSGDLLRISAMLPEPRGDAIVRVPVVRYQAACLKDGERWAVMSLPAIKEVAEARRTTNKPPATPRLFNPPPTDGLVPNDR